jgi:hypothetical protein
MPTVVFCDRWRNTRRPNDRLFGDSHLVMPAQAGIHDLSLSLQRKSWIPACAGMTWGYGRWVNLSGAWY